MNKELHDALSRIDDTMLNIDIKVKAINDKLDELIKALHDYDGDYDSNEEYGESSFEAFQDEAELNKRMDIIGQNGNEGSHYVTNEEADEDAEFSDYGMRIAKAVMNDKNNVRVGKDKDNNPAKHTDGNKKKYNNKYRRQPNTPVTPKKMSVVEHEKYRSPHKH